MPTLTVNARSEKERPAPLMLALDSCADGLLFFDFVERKARPRTFTYCNLTAVDLCLASDEAVSRRLVEVAFTARETACGPALIKVSAPQCIDFLLDEDAPANVYGVRVRIPANTICGGNERQRELAFTLSALDDSGIRLTLAQGLLALRAGSC